MKIIDIKNLKFKYNKTYIFKDFDMQIEENKFVTIAGNNTSGKTTLIKLISGLLPSNNSIIIGYSYVNDKRIHDHTREIGVVLGNELNSFLFEDVYKEMAFPLENLNMDPKEIEERILEIAKLFGINKILDKKVCDLTKSEKQQLLIAIALLHKPKILLLDNPFSMIDRITKDKIINKLLEYKKKNPLTIVLTTVDLEEALYSDYLYIIHKGNLVIEGKPISVLKEDSIINKIGLQLPFMVDLSLKLQFYNLQDDIELDIDRMVDNLWK